MSTSNVSVGGRRTFDLTTDREHESNYELVQIPAVSTINVESSDSEAFLHFGTPTSDGFSTFEYSKFKFERTSPEVMYLENSAGATGSLTLTMGVDMDPETDLKIDSVDSISSTVTTDVTNDTTREIGKARVMDSGGVLVDPLDDAEMQPVSASTSLAGASNAAAIDAGAYRTTVTASYDLSGAADVSVEVSADNVTWLPYATVSESAAATGSVDVSTGFRYVRAYASASVNTVAIGGKGV